MRNIERSSVCGRDDLRARRQPRVRRLGDVVARPAAPGHPEAGACAPGAPAARPRSQGGRRVQQLVDELLGLALHEHVDEGLERVGVGEGQRPAGDHQRVARRRAPRAAAAGRPAPAA